jgi:hypothetical protein
MAERQGSALLTRRRRTSLAGSNPAASAFRRTSPRSSAARAVGFEPTARPFESGRGVLTLRRRPTGRTAGCYPVDAGSSPAVAACELKPRSSSRPRMPVSQTGDAGSNPARGSSSNHALGRVWACGPAVSRVRRVRFPSRAPLAVARWMSTTLLPWFTGVRILPARLRRKASSEPAGRDPVEQGAIPWRRPKTTTGRLGRHRSDTADMRGSIPRSSTFGRRFGRVRTLRDRSASGCRGDGHPAGLGTRRSQVRLLPARPCAVEEWPSSRAS